MAVSSLALAQSAPFPLQPMLAKHGAMPADGTGYGFEFKWDGYRTILHIEGGRARVQSRSLRDVTKDYPELQPIAEALGGEQAILDGEIVVLDAQGRPSFDGLQQRLGYGRAPPTDAAVVFIAFDVPWLGGKSLLAQPYRVRRQALEALDLQAHGALVPAWHEDGAAVEEASRALGLEGMVAKRLDSAYEPGLRTGAWLKTKFLRRQEFVIGGWIPGEGGRRGQLGALLVGYYAGEKLVYAGRVGTGFTERLLLDLGARLTELARDASPFAGRPPDIPRNARYVAPQLVCEVAFTAWTRDGHLRLPSFKGLRPDKDPEDVIKEEP